MSVANIAATGNVRPWKPNVQGITIDVRVDGDRANSHAAKGANDPARDGAAIRNEHLVEHPRESPKGAGRVVPAGSRGSAGRPAERG